MDRRQFLRSAKTIAAGAGASAAFATLGLAQTRTPHGPPNMKRFNDQRWALDNIIQSNGIDWDQGRTSTLLRACGIEVMGDMATLRQRVRKYADIVPEFVALARRRETRAQQHEKAGEQIDAQGFRVAERVHGGRAWTKDSPLTR